MDDLCPDLHDATALHGDLYVVKLLQEFRFLTHEKKEQTDAQAHSPAAGDEETWCF